MRKEENGGVNTEQASILIDLNGTDRNYKVTVEVGGVFTQLIPTAHLTLYQINALP